MPGAHCLHRLPFAAIRRAPQGPMAVSYTHLDVYKRQLLTKRGHSVITAADGIEALAALERNSFDVVLMDEEMPRMNGLDTTRAIRKMETSTGRHLRIVGFTGNATDEDLSLIHI